MVGLNGLTRHRRLRMIKLNPIPNCEIVHDYLPISQNVSKKIGRRWGIKLSSFGFVVAHDTGNANSTARNNVDYYKRTAHTETASAHIFVDDKECIVCVPLDEKAWHVIYNVTKDNELFGGNANDMAIGVELCYFPNDLARSIKAYNNYLAVIKDLVAQGGLNPMRHVVGHHILDPQRKTDPANALKYINKTYNDLLDDLSRQQHKTATIDRNWNLRRDVSFASSNIILEMPKNSKLDIVREVRGAIFKGSEKWYEVLYIGNQGNRQHGYCHSLAVKIDQIPVKDTLVDYQAEIKLLKAEIEELKLKLELAENKISQAVYQLTK
jgi:N-acetyl-anhydromuramyl-L-alanine amidase AmpD